MSNTIKLKRSNSAGAIPSSLSPGELAVNTADRRLTVGNNSSVVVCPAAGVMTGTDYPLNPLTGQVFFNATSTRLYIYNGSSWIEATAGGTFTTVTASSNITSSGGHIISSIRPAFLAYLTSSIDSGRTIVFNNDSSNDAFDNNDNYNTSTGVFTAPVAGIYQFSVNLLAKTLTSNLEASIRKNNNLVSRVVDDIVAETTVWSTGAATVTLKLAVNDTVSVYSNAGGIYGVSTRGAGSYFSGHLVG